MEMFIFYLEIINQLGETYKIKIWRQDNSTEVHFNPQTKELKFCGAGELTDLLREHEYQFRKVLHTKRLDTFYVGFELKFCLRNKKDVAGFNNKNKLVVLDKRGNKPESYVQDYYQSSALPRIYTDGSFLEEIENGAFWLNADFFYAIKYC